MSRPRDDLEIAVLRPDFAAVRRALDGCQLFTVGDGDGIPYLAPHGALLYKAKAARPKDEADFSACLLHLSPETRAWLADAIARVHPEHPWRARLD